MIRELPEAIRGYVSLVRGVDTWEHQVFLLAVGPVVVVAFAALLEWEQNEREAFGGGA